jgi:TRAP transporter 4TM/12TM fusion protein
MDNDEGNRAQKLEQGTRKVFSRPQRIVLLTVTVLGVTLAILQIFLIYPLLESQYMYWLLALFLSPVFLIYRATKDQPTEKIPWYDIVLFAMTLIISVYLAVHAWDITHGGGAFIAPMPVSIMSIIFCVLALEAVRRAGGTTLFFFTALFAVYPLFTGYMPGLLRGNALPFFQVVRYHVLSTESIIGIPMQVVATLVIGYMVFGVALTATGGGEFFLNFAFSLFGRQKGGPAKVAIISSSLFGSLSGSVISNVITSGSVTIPTMKKTGYPPYYAAAVEACASTGGCIMPPVMGAVAFVMASFLSVPYVEVAKAAAIPAIMYYLGLYLQVDFYARKVGLAPLPAAEIPKLMLVLKKGFHYIAVFLLLIYLLYLRLEAQAPFYASAILIAVAMARKSSRLHRDDFIRFFENIGKILCELVAILAACGFIIGAFSLTGVASSFSREMIQLAGGNVPLMLVFGALGSFVLGMGMTITACYIFLSIILVPAVQSVAHFDIMAVHLFVLYWGIVSFITPPVALGSYTAAGVAGASPLRTGFTSMRLGMVTYIIPFFFIYSPALILHGTTQQIVYQTLTVIVGIFLISGALEGYIPRAGKLALWTRIPLGIAGFLVAMPEGTTDMIGAGIAAVLLAAHVLRNTLSKKSPAAGDGSSVALNPKDCDSIPQTRLEPGE